jgi:flavodoxin
MKGVVVYDSYYGNTKTVAEAIVDELNVEGHDAELRSVRQKYSAPPQGDIMFLGSPIRMGSTTRRVKKYVKKLDRHLWKDKPLVVFTTILELPEDASADRKNSRENYDIAAGRKLVDEARSQGLNALDSHLWVDAKANKGPLVDTGAERAMQFTRDTIRSLEA